MILSMLEVVLNIPSQSFTKSIRSKVNSSEALAISIPANTNINNSIKLIIDFIFSHISLEISMDISRMDIYLYILTVLYVFLH